MVFTLQSRNEATHPEPRRRKWQPGRTISCRRRFVNNEHRVAGEAELYDGVTLSTSFEGDMENCEIAERGYSGDSRGDRPQVCIGLVVTEEGFPLGSEVFAGKKW